MDEMVPSARLKSFVRRNADRIIFSAKGNGLKDRGMLLRVAFLNLMPKKILDITNLQGKLSQKIETLCQGIRVNAGGYVIVLNGFESYALMESIDTLEPFMMERFRPKQGDVVVDVGAYIGTFTLPTAKAVGKEGFVFAIEPTPKNYLSLLNNISANHLDNVYVYHGAAYNEPTRLCLYISAVNSSESSIYQKRRGEAVWVKADTVDNMLSALPTNLTHVDWVKIDVEEAEMNVLEGMVETLKRFSPVLLIEVWERNEDSLQKFLKANGYQCERISDRIIYKSTYNIYMECRRMEKMS